MSRRGFFLRSVSIVKFVSLLLLFFILFETVDCSGDGKLFTNAICFFLRFLEAIGGVDLIVGVTLELQVLQVAHLTD